MPGLDQLEGVMPKTVVWQLNQDPKWAVEKADNSDDQLLAKSSFQYCVADDIFPLSHSLHHPLNNFCVFD